jgi:hypothetical protein
MKTFRFLSVVIVTAALLVNACDAPLTSIDIATPTPEEEPALPTVTIGPVCSDATAFGRIYDHWPSGFQIVPLTPELTWFYSPGSGYPNGVTNWADVCTPQSYTIYLSTGPDFDDEIVFEVPAPVVFTDPTKLTLETSITSGLEPLKVYRWMAVGHYNDLVLESWKIADIHNDNIWPPRNTVNMTYKRCTFRTGPECPSGQIDVPILLSPANGEVLQTLTPKLLWDVDTCMPLVFMVEISTTADFANPQPYVAPSQPGDYTKITQRNYPYAYIDYTLRDCTKFYWRIKGGIDINNSREWGAYSEVGTFYVDFGQCPTPTPTATATRQPTLTSTPTNPPKPTSTPKPFTCTGLSQESCLAHADKCIWYVPLSHPESPYCKAR